MTLRVTTLNTTIKNATLSITFTLSGVLLNEANHVECSLLSVATKLEGIFAKIQSSYWL
jgi:hypothetical protein